MAWLIPSASTTDFRGSIPRLLLAFASCLAPASAILKQELVRDGPATDIVGYKGMSYQAIHYQPLCGSLGSGEQYSTTIQIGDKCTAAMDVFGNTTGADANMAVYDLTGVRLKDGQVGFGYEVCLCFALGQPESVGTVNGATCLWVDGSGQGDYEYSLAPISDYVFSSNYRVVDKALPQCRDVDVKALSASWSATAVLPSATEAVVTGQPSGASRADDRADDQGSSGGLDIGKIVGIVVGVFITLAIIGGILACCCGSGGGGGGTGSSTKSIWVRLK